MLIFKLFFQLHWDVKLSTLVLKGTTDWMTAKLQILENRVMNNRFSLFDFALDNKEIYIDLQTLCNLLSPTNLL